MGWFFQDDPKATPKADAKPSPAPVTPVPVGMPGLNTTQASAFVDNPTNEFYEVLHQKTVFENTQTAVILNKYLNPIKDMALNDQDKLKIAVANARTNDNMDTNSILGTFEGLKTTLSQEQQKFQQAMDAKTAVEVTARQHKIDDLTTAITAKQQEIAQMQQELTSTTTEMMAAQTKITQKKQMFDFSVQRRAGELDAEKQRYATLLQ